MKSWVRVPLTKGQSAIVDLADFDRVDRTSWYYDKAGYAYGWVNGRVASMHRTIMGEPQGMEIDHRSKELEGLDNRRANLRLATHNDNCRNGRLSKRNKSGYKGVGWHKAAKKWHAYITVNGQSVYLGLHLTKESAAHAYNQAATKYFGEFARLNETGGAQCLR